MYYSEQNYIEMFQELDFNLPKGHKGMVSCHLHKDKHPSMSIDLQNGIFHCFSCGFSGYIPNLYREETGKFWNETKLSSFFSEKKIPVKKEEPPKRFKLEFTSVKSDALKKWLEYRGISPLVAKAAGARYGNAKIFYQDADSNGELVEKNYTVFDRVVFPVYDEKRKLSSLEMRFPFLGNEPPKFKESVKKVLYPKCSSVNTLYEYYNLDHNKKLFVLEGLMDCLAFRSLTGIKNSTSIFGAKFTNHQKDLLNSFKEICYVYNNDEAGLASLESAREFYKGKLTVLKPAGNYDDVGEMAQNSFKEIKKWMQTES